MPLIPHPSSFLLSLLALSQVHAQDKPFHISPAAEDVMDKHCSSCHGEDSQKGDIRFDQLEQMPLRERLDLLNRMQEQAFLSQMPPKPRKTQPTPTERKVLVDWIASELKVHNASTLEDKMRMPAYGNYVDHEALFSGKITDAPYTPARRWLVSPQIFNQRMFDIFGPEERGKQGNSFGVPKIYGITNPFVQTDSTGVRYYDNDTLDGGTLLVMLTNAEWISWKQIRSARVINGELKADYFPDPKDKWAPRKTSPAFEAVILSKTPPTEAQLGDAIRTQFQAVLRRLPTDVELARYLKLIRDSIAVGGNSEGLRQMLVAVLLESELLYRQEFGEGVADAHGRKMLSPREGAFALSYAIGDRGPDDKLLQAAANGQLKTREDYKREVLRLLDEKTYYKEAVVPEFTTKNLKPIVTSLPKINRFFREFFGYPNAVKVFKDPERSGFYYDSPGRGSFGTPGVLVDEADMFVERILKQDRNVFENLLGSEEFFVAPVDDAAKKIAMLEAMYDHFKATNWKKDPEQVAKDHADYIKKNMPYGFGPKQLIGAMIHVEKFRAKKLPPNPDWGYPFGSRLMLWVNSYNIAPFDWNYAVEQPFKLPNRKGILTHPAWLIAHSLNTENDPVRRGRWVREKLLAGRVPDVPITVDAVVPEDHHKTLRERLDKVTSAEQCIKCHQYMNPLGLPFEIFDDFGRFRTQEPLEHAENVVGKGGSGKYVWDLYKTLPVNAKGVLDSTGDPALDGEVSNALDMIGRLATSPRVRQSIIRHAFRFYLGRNEMLSDSKTLIDADNAYVKSGGSFKAVIVSLLTSDSFLYRKSLPSHP